MVQNRIMKPNNSELSIYDPGPHSTLSSSIRLILNYHANTTIFVLWANVASRRLRTEGRRDSISGNPQHRRQQEIVEEIRKRSKITSKRDANADEKPWKADREIFSHSSHEILTQLTRKPTSCLRNSTSYFIYTKTLFQTGWESTDDFSFPNSKPSLPL